MSEMFIPDAFGFSWLNRHRSLSTLEEVIAAEKWQRSGRPSPQVYLDKLPFGWARILRLHGRSMDASHFTHKDSEMKHGDCYSNAALHSTLERRAGNTVFAYAEGLHMGKYKPILHAWNMLGDYAFDGTFGPRPYALYYGIVFSGAFMDFMEFVLKPKQWHPVSGIFNRIEHTGPYVQNYCRLRHFA